MEKHCLKKTANFFYFIAAIPLILLSGPFEISALECVTAATDWFIFVCRTGSFHTLWVIWT